MGIYQIRIPEKDVTYLRFAFAGEVLGFDETRDLDQGIVRALWLTPEEIEASADRHRSPFVVQCVKDWQAGRRFPLELIRHHPSAPRGLGEPSPPAEGRRETRERSGVS